MSATPDARSDPGAVSPEPEDAAFRRPAERFLGLAEDGIYAAVGALLLVAAAIVFVVSVVNLVADADDGVLEAVRHLLDTLLLTFILLELLAGVRATVVSRKLVAEPFLVAGIIAAIKEIIVITVTAGGPDTRDRDEFDRIMIEVGVLGGLVLVLSLAALLSRRKEREPEEV
jgi:uncharacterized membrane protein (DUF373 family)